VILQVIPISAATKHKNIVFELMVRSYLYFWVLTQQMKPIILSILIFLAIVVELKAQPTDYTSIGQNGIYAEYYLIRHDFSSGLVSLNYERIIGKKRKTSIRMGIYPDFRSTISVPVTISWITSPLKNHHFEYGIGAVYRIEHFQGKYYHDIPAVMIPLMYRYQKSHGIFFRGGINFFYSWPMLASPSVSLGYKF